MPVIGFIYVVKHLNILLLLLLLLLLHILRGVPVCLSAVTSPHFLKDFLAVVLRYCT
jgi:hypothetical protein